jgi:hypothetical protein
MPRVSQAETWELVASKLCGVCFDQHHRQQARPGEATRDRMRGVGASVIASQSRQENFSRTCSMILQRRGSHS